MNAEQFAPYIVHTLEEIKGFFGPYRFLSNFHECEIEYNDIKYRNTEAAYQAQKSLHKNEREMFMLMDGKEAKAAGRKITLRTDWERVKDTIMFDLLCLKFTSSAELFDALQSTGKAYLEETNWWGDKYWGADPTKSPIQLSPVEMGVSYGQNQLGKLLMIVRSAYE